MEDPLRDIDGVVAGLVEAKNATEQKYLLESVFSVNASFDHPLCTVNASSTSRNEILKIFQWLRIIGSPKLEIITKAFDAEKLVLFIDCTEVVPPTSTLMKSFYKPKARITTTFFLKRTSSKKYIIKRQEDRYQSQDIAKFVPFSSTLVIIFKHIATSLCIYLTIFAQFFLHRWRP